YFYRVDGDLRGKVASIDTGKCPLYLLTGEYDFSCTPEDTERTAKSIKGAEVTVMRELGHFPMSENPRQFRGYILPVLEKIRVAKGGYLVLVEAVPWGGVERQRDRHPRPNPPPSRAKSLDNYSVMTMT